MRSAVIFTLMFAMLSIAGCGGGSSNGTVPAITSFTPTTGSAGTTVAISGTNFSTTPANNVVRFNGVAADVISSSATQIVTAVPAGATPGPIRVTTGGLTATSSVNFIPLVAGTVLMGGTIQGKTLSLTESVTVSTIAGSAGSHGSADGIGTAARFNSPCRITTDGTNLYVADSCNCTIRKIVISSGAVTTIAGKAGVPGSADGTGAAARFEAPSNITTDGTNLYVTDYDKIRKVVIATGAVTTLAGTAGVSGSADGIGAAARFSNLSAITTDGINLYVTECGGNNTVRKIVIATGEVTTIAGTAYAYGTVDGIGVAARFNGPFGITTDGTNLYVADLGGSSIRKIAISTGAVSTLTISLGVGPVDVTTDGADLYATYSSRTVRKISLTDGTISIIAGYDYGSADGIGTAAGFNGASGITTDGTSLYVAEIGNETIRRLY